MKNYVSSGQRLELTAPTGGVVSGTAYKIGQLFVVAAADAAQATPFIGLCEGVFTLPKNTSQALTEGALVYWDDTGKEVTTTATANLLIGVAAEAAQAADATGVIRLNGMARADG